MHAANWAVVATVDEPPALVQAFAAWHIALGARQVTLYFDRPDDPAAAALENIPQVAVVRCDFAHWAQRAGGRPAKHEIRQVHNATHAYRMCQADWLLHCDADEFLWAPDGMQTGLTGLDPSADVAIVPVAERVYLPDTSGASIFAGAFRRPFAGSDATGGMTRRGLAGHAHGKAFARTTRNLDMSIHRPKAGYPLRQQTLAGVELLHFDGLTPLHWLVKLLRRADAFARQGGMEPSPHRQAQIAALRADRSGAYDVHDSLKRLPPQGARRLARNGLLLQPAFDPLPCIAATLDLSPAVFDERVRCDYPAVVAQLDQNLRVHRKRGLQWRPPHVIAGQFRPTSRRYPCRLRPSL